MPDKIYLRRGLAADLPTLAQGEPGFTLDTKKLYVGTATGNQGIASSAPTLATWIAPTLLNSWVNYGGGGYSTAGYYKDEFGIVHLKGLIKAGTTTSGTPLFTLPPGYKPLQTAAVPIGSSNGTTAVAGFIEIFGTGTVQIGTFAVGNTYLSLENISFRAEQ